MPLPRHFLPLTFAGSLAFGFSAALAWAQTAPPPAATPAVPLGAYTVTGTRERALLAETPASIGAIPVETIRQTAPLHPGQILGQIPGVAVAVTNGEGHTTAIRQPFSTSPLYLFLEDGIPVRATGFFNHNALYEVNLPGAGGLEVVRGPGTALYGSDAIGGIINVLTHAPLGLRETSLSAEAGAFGVYRALLGFTTPLGGYGAARADVNRTHNDGWRDHTGYDRRSVNVRWDHALDADTTLKAILGWSKIDQETGANSPLPSADYQQDPTRNLFAIAYRQVDARRFSLEYERRFGPGLLSVTPYFRDDAMELNASFTLSSDPRIDRGQNRSAGALLKWRSARPGPLRARLIGGLDFDYSPGSRREDNLLVSRTGTGASTIYRSYTVGTRIYDYEVTFRSVSPYVHTEFSPTSRLRLTAGARFDTLRFAMDNRLPVGAVSANVLGNTRYYGQIADGTRTFSRFSPKLGATYALQPHAHLYASYNFGFRTPSESQLFRAGPDSTPAAALTRARLAQGLNPIRARQLELGLRGDLAGWDYSLVAYDLDKRDDLVSQRDLATNVSTNVNAGATRHRGLEAGLGGPLLPRLRLDTALSYARHTYERWITATANFSGHRIESAPAALTNTRLTWTPAARTFLQAEWVYLGSYWLEAGNNPAFGKYPGHHLLHLRVRQALNDHLLVFARLMNATDRRFADSASVSSNTPVFSPGLPRSLYGGVELRW